jgi:hypothetical protein
MEEVKERRAAFNGRGGSPVTRVDLEDHHALFGAHGG